MSRTAIRIAIALVTFLIGVSVVYLIWFAGKRSAPTSTVISSSQPKPVESPTASSDAKPLEKSVEDEWNELAEIGGCLFGSEYYSPQSEARIQQNGPPPEAPGVFYNQRWQAFFRRNKKETVPFLIKQIPDQSKTNLHVDPFQPPIKGELAVYALQHILKVNWYELKEGYRNRYDKVEYPFTHQALLQRIIKTKNGTKEMQDLWMKYYESQTS